MFTTLLAFGLITFVGEVPALGGTTALLLLCVFTVVNIACWCCARTRSHKHSATPTILPVLGALCCAFLVGPWTGRDPVQYKVAGVLLAIGVAAVGGDRVDQPRHWCEGGGADAGDRRHQRPRELTQDRFGWNLGLRSTHLLACMTSSEKSATFRDRACQTSPPTRAREDELVGAGRSNAARSRAKARCGR